MRTSVIEVIDIYVKTRLNVFGLGDSSSDELIEAGMNFYL